jgi:AbrB family looped-hinge helix DNA binding protein
MGTASKETIKMKVFPKGQVVIPVSLRKKYKIDIGDRIDVISKPDGILLKPLAKENIQRSLTERLFGIFSDYAAEKTRPTKTDIEKATEAGFIEGWNK